MICLFLGGPLDGERKLFDSTPNIVAGNYYRWSPFAGTTIYTHESLSAAQAFTRLVGSYKPNREPTLADLDQLVAQRRAGMKEDPLLRHKTNRYEIREQLKGDKRLTVKQIAKAIGCTPRAVQCVVCNVMINNQKWMDRVKPEGSEYVYFLTGRNR